MTSEIKWRLTVGFALVFLAGIAIGLFVGAAHAHRAFLGRHSHPLTERMRNRLQADLQLTPEQMQKISPILARTAQQLEDIRTDTGLRVSETLRQAHEEMASYLSLEQRKKLETSRPLLGRPHHHLFSPPPGDSP